MKTFGLSYKQVMEEPQDIFEYNILMLNEIAKEENREAKKQKQKARKKRK